MSVTDIFPHSAYALISGPRGRIRVSLPVTQRGIGGSLLS